MRLFALYANDVGLSPAPSHYVKERLDLSPWWSRAVLPRSDPISTHGFPGF